MPLEPGDIAPEFTLTRDDSRTTVSLADHLGAGPVLLLFYPFAFSSTCTAELCAVADDFAAYQDLGATVFAISVDPPYAAAAFARACNATFPFLSDFNREASAAYGVLRESLGELKGVSERAAFVIGPDGTITYAWVGEDPGVFPPLEEIKGAVAAV